jgi:hypothetical protein
MSNPAERARLRRLLVVGTNKQPATIQFHERLTFITGVSNTGKSHILKCVDFALGGQVPKRDFREARGYDRVVLEIAKAQDVITIRRSFDDEETALWFPGPWQDFADDQAESLPAQVDKTKPRGTLGGRLLEFCGFDPSLQIPRNQRGQTQSVSLRTMSHLFVVSEEAVISENSPVVPPSYTPTAELSMFQLVLQGTLPTDAEISRLRDANKLKETAKQRIAALEPLIEDLRVELSDANVKRSELEAGIADVDQSLSDVAGLVADSGRATEALVRKRNVGLDRVREARSGQQRSAELTKRFQLLAEHYQADESRLRFVLEGGHFFDQIAAAHCPRCGQLLDAEDPCHEEKAEFADVERAARAELKKLAPRREDLDRALADARQDLQAARADEHRWTAEFERLEDEIRVVANPSAEGARARVAELAKRRQELERHLVRFRELDRYLAVKQEADLQRKTATDKYKPGLAGASLRALQGEIQAVLTSWSFPLETGLTYSVADDDLVIDGKARVANGKGVRAITHAAFAVGLMRHAFAAGTPHPGFNIIDTPLTPYRGAATDDAEDRSQEQAVHVGALQDLAAAQVGQTVIIDNIDPPLDLSNAAAVVVFTGPGGQGRRGFYPTS